MSFPLLIGLVFLLVLAGICRRIAGDVLHPSVIFSLVWSGMLAGLLLTGDVFYPVHTPTVVIFAVGAVGMAAGSILALWSRWIAPEPGEQVEVAVADRAWVRRALDALVVVVALLLPLYWMHIRAEVAQMGVGNFWLGLRLRAIRASELEAGQWESIMSNVVYLATFVVLALVLETDGTWRRWLRAAVAFALAFVYQALTGGQAGLIQLIISIPLIVFLKAGRVRWRLLGTYGAAAVATFLGAAFALEKGFVSQGLSLTQNLDALFEVFLWYVFGGTVAFDRIVTGDVWIPNSWSVWRFFQHTANTLGAHIEMPSLHAQYAPIAHDKTMNVYTMYFPYYVDFGLAGVLVITGLLGLVIGLLYRWAHAGYASATILYGLLASGLVLSGFNEPFFTGLNYWIKAALFFVLLYALPRLMLRRSDSPELAPA